MGLDLVVWGQDPADEIDGLRIGTSSDFNNFRRVVEAKLERDGLARFPMLMRHGAWDATWDSTEAAVLEHELGTIASELSRLPHENQPGAWGRHADHERESEPSSLLESFVTMDGDLFVLRFIELARLAQKHDGILSCE